MIDSIQIALSGMVGFQRGLEVISNNVSNMNTAGFRGSDVDFADIFDGSPGDHGSPQDGRQLKGAGVDSSRTSLDLRAGQSQTTGQDLDVLLNGKGYFAVRDVSGDVRYTRDGHFDFDADGNLIMAGQKTRVMGLDAGGQLVPITLQNLQTSPSKVTSTIKFSGNLASDGTTFSIDAVPVIDATGNSHTVKLVFTKDTTTSQGVNTVNWNFAASEGANQVGSGSLQFIGSVVTTSTVALQLSFNGSAAQSVTLDFGAITDTASGNTSADPAAPGGSSLAVASQDGLATGTLTGRTFDAKGVLQLTYSNGQTARGGTLALAEVPDEDALVELSDSLLDYQGAKPVTLRRAADDLKLQAQSLEGSNVDLTTEFSALILMQRGYQAASEVVSTANDMAQTLISMRSGK